MDCKLPIPHSLDCVSCPHQSDCAKCSIFEIDWEAESKLWIISIDDPSLGGKFK